MIIIKHIFISFIIISIIGTILHFTYKISKKNKIVGIFSSVNESTWEHIKIALSGLFIWSIIDGYKFMLYPNYFFAKLVSVLSIIFIIPLIFYGYQIFTKKSVAFINILSFYIAIFISQYLFIEILSKKAISYSLYYISFILLICIYSFYLLATIYPPKKKWFLDPVTKTYGIKKK